MRVDNSHCLQIGIDDYGPHKLHSHFEPAPKSSCLARLPESRQQLIQPPVQSEGLLFDIVHNVDLTQIDGHISGVWLAGHQAHHRSLDQLITPANAQFQNHQFLPVV